MKAAPVIAVVECVHAAAALPKPAVGCQTQE